MLHPARTTCASRLCARCDDAHAEHAVALHRGARLSRLHRTVLHAVSSQTGRPHLLARSEDRRALRRRMRALEVPQVQGGHELLQLQASAKTSNQRVSRRYIHAACGNQKPQHSSNTHAPARPREHATSARHEHTYVSAHLLLAEAAGPEQRALRLDRLPVRAHRVVKPNACVPSCREGARARALVCRSGYPRVLPAAASSPRLAVPRARFRPCTPPGPSATCLL